MQINKNIRPRRSFIFTPGLNPEMFPKAIKVLIWFIELEDGIAKIKSWHENMQLKFLKTNKLNGVERI